MIPALVVDLDARREEAIAEEIRALLHAAYRVEGELLGVVDFPPLARTAKAIQETPATFHGLREAGRLVAVTEIETSGEGGRHIASLGVHPDHFRQGLARRLLLHVLSRPPLARFTVSTGADNHPALDLYRQLGFVEQRRWRTPREGIAMVTLARELPAR